MGGAVLLGMQPPHQARHFAQEGFEFGQAVGRRPTPFPRYLGLRLKMGRLTLVDGHPVGLAAGGALRPFGHGVRLALPCGGVEDGEGTAKAATTNLGGNQTRRNDFMGGIGRGRGERFAGSQPFLQIPLGVPLAAQAGGEAGPTRRLVGHKVGAKPNFPPPRPHEQPRPSAGQCLAVQFGQLGAQIVVGDGHQQGGILAHGDGVGGKGGRQRLGIGTAEGTDGHGYFWRRGRLIPPHIPFLLEQAEGIIDLGGGDTAVQLAHNLAGGLPLPPQKRCHGHKQRLAQQNAPAFPQQKHPLAGHNVGVQIRSPTHGELVS